MLYLLMCIAYYSISYCYSLYTIIDPSSIFGSTFFFFIASLSFFFICSSLAFRFLSYSALPPGCSSFFFNTYLACLALNRGSANLIAASLHFAVLRSYTAISSCLEVPASILAYLWSGWYNFIIYRLPRSRRTVSALSVSARSSK